MPDMSHWFDQLDDLPATEKKRMQAWIEQQLIREDSIEQHTNAAELAASIDPTFVCTPANLLMADEIERTMRTRRGRLLITVPPQEGKLIADNELVPTPSGWTRHGDLRVGDWVLHTSGKPIRVVAVHPKAMASLRVRTSEHGAVRVHPRHEWTVYDRSRGEWRTVETQYLMTQKLRSGGRFRFQLPHREALRLPQAALPVDPYTLGVWLGDGSSAAPRITHSPADRYELPYPITSTAVHATTGVVTDYYGGGLCSALRALGVLGDKHIPPIYLRASEEQRRALLSGLIDSDGHVAKTCQVSFDNTNRALVEATAELARTLGYRAHVHNPTAPRTSSSGVAGKKPMWRATFTVHDGMEVARLERKLLTGVATRRRAAITAIDEIDPEQGNCITVDSPDGLYMVGERFTPTHNTTLTAVWGVIRALQLQTEWRVILASFSAALAEESSRAARNILAAHGTGAVDPVTREESVDVLGIGLANDRAQAANWRIQGHKGGMVAVGLGGTITGRPADLLIIDDPLKGMEAADSETERRKVIEGFQGDLTTRLAPGAPVILIQCMTGDTSVRMAGGDEKPLREVRVGDRVATWDEGRLGASRVTNWANQGPDDILIVTMQSGRQVRANARHPFLVQREGHTEWVKAGQITSGDRLVALSEAPGKPGPSAPSTGANSTPSARACACPTTANSDGPTATGHHPPIPSHDDEHTSATGTESTPTSTTLDSQRRAASAPSASARSTAAPDTGRTSCASITTTTRAGSEDSCATTATSWLDGAAQPSDYGPGPTTWTVDEVVSVTPGGVEDVFDIEVERTENFIANGVVSHNTRWHEMDLAGWILANEDKLPPERRRWKHINLPALAEDGLLDSLGREPGEWLESARGRREQDWEETRDQVGPRVWAALYQGTPTPASGGLFHQEWFDQHRIETLPETTVRIVSIDPAETGRRDEAGIIAAAATVDGKVVWTEDWSGRMTSDQWARRAVLLALKTDAQEIAFEAYTTEQTYKRVIRQAWADIRDQARLLRDCRGDREEAALLLAAQEEAPPDPIAALAELDGIIIPDLTDPPFLIRGYRGKGDKVARATGARQASSTGRLRIVGALPALERQAVTWQQGQKSPDRMDAAVNAYERVVALIGGRSVVLNPVDRTRDPGRPRGTLAARRRA